MKYGILDFLTESTIEAAVLGPGAEVECFECREECALPDRISSLSGVMLWHMLNLGKETVRRLEECKVIVRVGVGYDNVDRIAAGQAGIPVVTIPDYGTNDVADHTLAILLALCRRIPRYQDALRLDPVGGWRPEVGGELRRLTGTTLGIVGLGRIGSAVALRAKSFGMRVAFYDPYLADGFEKSLQVIRMASLKELLNASDYVSLHVPLTDETRGMIDARALASAKPGMILVNVARGGIVSLDDVAEALETRRIQAFGADVLDPEPPHVEHRLIKIFRSAECSGRILLTPHSAFYASESRTEMRTKAAQRMLEAVQGIPLRNCVNSDCLRNPRAPVWPTSPPPWDLLKGVVSR